MVSELVSAPNRHLHGLTVLLIGWSSTVPNYNPRDIVDNLKRKLDGGDFEPMDPWFRGFEVRVISIDVATANHTVLFRARSKRSATRQTSTNVPVSGRWSTMTL